jgi:hypothetical protein
MSDPKFTHEPGTNVRFTVIEDAKKGTVEAFEAIEYRLRKLSGVYMTAEGERRITMEGLRESLKANSYGRRYADRHTMVGGRAFCSCCGNAVTVVEWWQTLQICEACFKEADKWRNP